MWWHICMCWGKWRRKKQEAEPPKRWDNGSPIVATFPFFLFSFAPPPPSISQCNILVGAHPSPPPSPTLLILCRRQGRHWIARLWGDRRRCPSGSSIHRPNQNSTFFSSFSQISITVTYSPFSSLIPQSFPFRCCSFWVKTGTCSFTQPTIFIRLLFSF